MDRIISADLFVANIDQLSVFDVRRKDDYDAASQQVRGAEWKDPAGIDTWVDSIPTDKDVAIYCVRGGGVSNSVVDRLLAAGCSVGFIEGGIVALETVGDVLINKPISR